MLATDTLTIALRDDHCLQALFGSRDEHRRFLERELDATLLTRDHSVLVTAEDEPKSALAARVLGELARVVEQGRTLGGADLAYFVRMAKAGEPLEELGAVLSEHITTTERGKALGPRTLGQRRYIEAIREHDLTFSVGPAGTGKTYLAVAMAVAALRDKRISRIILTRPAVEAGERLGFLPGDLQEKVDPYLRPLYDALYEMLGIENTQALQGKRIIEVAPLAYMRGRTLNDSFVILDEAQNTTPPQMKMFLTRMGFGTKLVVTGDRTQKDLPPGQQSGLDDACRVLGNVEGIRIVELTDRDVVRHRMVQKIVLAYEAAERDQAAPDA